MKVTRESIGVVVASGLWLAEIWLVEGLLLRSLMFVAAFVLMSVSVVRLRARRTEGDNNSEA